jgi:hypothetical protein
LLLLSEKIINEIIYTMEVNLNSIAGVPYADTYLNSMSANPTVILVLSVVIIAYYALFASLGVSNGSQADSSAKSGMLFVEILLWGVFVVLVLLNGMSYIFNIDITASIKNLFSDTPEIDIIVDPDDIAGGLTEQETTVPELKFEKQVFHVPGNKYSYGDSKAVCKAYGGRLATYKEVDGAYDKGADWCSFGWSDGQMALYPTQYDKWSKLQTIKGHEHDCGRPGINGGFIDNKAVRFGINCFGYKPKITQDEAQLMAETPLYPITKKEIEFDKKVDYWRNKLPEILVAPFNYNNWSVI